MNRTAGEIRSVARNPRRSARYRRRLPRAAMAARIYQVRAERIVTRYPPAVATIELDRLTKVYPDGTRAVDCLDLDIADGELVVFVGPSGCGKTSALRMVAGLEEITDGEVRLGERVVNDLPPRQRDIAMVFQNYALYPHKSVYDNLAFGLRMRKIAKGEQRRRV